MGEEAFSAVNITDRSFRETKICLNKTQAGIKYSFLK